MLNRRTLLAAAGFSLSLLMMSPVRADTNDGARQFIQKLADTAMSTVAVKGLSDEERADRFRMLFVDAFDLPEIAKLVLTRYWRVATPEQRSEFLKLFEDIQVYTWTRRFKDYSGETLDIFGVAPEGEGDLQVDSQIRRHQQPPINVAWRVRGANAGFHVIDIKVEGASMAFTHRSEYAAVIQRSGGDFGGLLDVMRQKLAELRVQP